LKDDEIDVYEIPSKEEVQRTIREYAKHLRDSAEDLYSLADQLYSELMELSKVLKMRVDFEYLGEI